MRIKFSEGMKRRVVDMIASQLSIVDGG